METQPVPTRQERMRREFATMLSDITKNSFKGAFFGLMFSALVSRFRRVRRYVYVGAGIGGGYAF
jgi:hypothetical protein